MGEAAVAMSNQTVIAHGSMNSKSLTTRRRALEVFGGVIASLPMLSHPPQKDGTLQYALIDALEEHGQWADNFFWSGDIHKSMGAEVTVFARGVASGEDGAAVATMRALLKLEAHEHPPVGAVVVLSGAPGVLRLSDARVAYRMVRSGLPSAAYCAYSPLYDECAEDRITAEIAVGWRRAMDLKARWLRS